MLCLLQMFHIHLYCHLSSKGYGDLYGFLNASLNVEKKRPSFLCIKCFFPCFFPPCPSQTTCCKEDLGQTRTHPHTVPLCPSSVPAPLCTIRRCTESYDRQQQPGFKESDVCLSFSSQPHRRWSAILTLRRLSRLLGT